MPVLVGYLLLFVTVGVGFILVHLLVGKLVRPARPDPEKLTIYECGEPTIGSAWVQFDLRFYVVALLFVIFDVEVAFFFPWAVVFGKTNELASADLSAERRAQLTRDLTPFPAGSSAGTLLARADRLAQLRQDEKAAMEQRNAARLEAATREIAQLEKEMQQEASANRAAANRFGWIAFIDILIFFGVLLVGFAYLWKRGDLEWVRSTAAERPGLPEPRSEPIRRESLVAAETAAH